MRCGSLICTKYLNIGMRDARYVKQAKIGTTFLFYLPEIRCPSQCIRLDHALSRLEQSLHIVASKLNV